MRVCVCEYALSSGKYGEHVIVAQMEYTHMSACVCLICVAI